MARAKQKQITKAGYLAELSMVANNRVEKDRRLVDKFVNAVDVEDFIAFVNLTIGDVSRLEDAMLARAEEEGLPREQVRADTAKLIVANLTDPYKQTMPTEEETDELLQQKIRDEMTN